MEPTYLALSIVALVAGPALIRLLGSRRAVSVALDAFVLVVIGGLVFVHILPEGVEQGGWVALLAAGVGLLIPTLGERALRTDVKRTHLIVLVLGLLALGLHAFLDGMVLGGSPHDHGTEAAAGAHAGHAADAPAASESGRQALLLSIVLHRLPVGIGLWWIVRGAFGLRLALSLLLAIVGATIGGFFAGGPLYSAGHGTFPAILQCLLAGSLLHVVIDTHGPVVGRPGRHDDLVSALGALAALGILFLLPRHAETLAGPMEGPLQTFVDLALISAPALLLAYLTVGLAHVLVPGHWVEFLRRGGPLGQALRGVGVGLPIPVCSCGVVPLYRELILKGVPVAAAIAFLIATPELEIAAALLSFQLLGVEVAVARLICAAGLALLVALIVSRFAPRNARPSADGETRSDDDRLATVVGRGLRYGFGEAVDSTGPWILLGLAIAALLTPVLDPEWFAGLSPVAQVPLMALVGMPLYVCASGSTPLAAVLLLKGMSPGAALAFLLTGPATNVTTVGVLSRLHGRRTAIGFVLTMLALAIAFGLLVDVALPQVSVPAMLGDHEHVGTWWQIAAAGILGAALLLSLVRQGTRGFVGRIASSAVAWHDHDREGGHSCCADEPEPEPGCCH